MNPIKALTLLFACCIIFFTSCKKEENQCSDASQYPFLEVGHEWVFYYAPSLFNSEDTVTVTVANKTSDGNYLLSYVGQNNPNLFTTEGYYLACGEKLYGGGEPAKTSDTWFLSTDLNVGDSWTRDASNGNTTVEHSLLSKTTTLNLPAGTFNNCWKVTYHQVGTFNTDTIFWRHDIGYLKYSGTLDYYLISKNY